jgi:hypothetical protein
VAPAQAAIMAVTPASDALRALLWRILCTPLRPEEVINYKERHASVPLWP